MRADRLSEPAHSHKAISAAELLSFLKETRAIHTWTEKDLAQTLNLSSPQAKNAIAVLQLEGYIEPAGSTEKWRITEQGELVSGAKPPRFTRHSVENAVAALRDRIKAVNEDRNAPYRITEAVAFGDFLGERARVQAGKVGIRLVPKAEGGRIASAKEDQHRAVLWRACPALARVRSGRRSTADRITGGA
jgi:hypothetical protein